MPLIQPVQTSKRKSNTYKKCNECNRKRKTLDESHQICHVCYKIKKLFKSSGNKVIDDFIRHTQVNYVRKEDGKLEIVPYDQFKNIEFIAEGGFSKIYKATWVDGPIRNWDMIKSDNWKITRSNNYTVVLKRLNDSKNITSKELNELKVFYQIYSNTEALYTRYNISNYFGITQDPITNDFIIIMPYYNSGDLIHYISNDFYNISWYTKLDKLDDIALGLSDIHELGIIHRDFHSGNIFFSNYRAYIGDLGISKSATECADNINENYGIIPYMAPEIFQGQKYTTASDIYSFGMIMWEFMTGRRPFWDRNHDIELIIKICDGLRPQIVTNAPEGYVELMKECWHSDPHKRPIADDLESKVWKIKKNERKNSKNNNPTKIIKSLDIGPVSKNNPGAIYKSRPLSHMIQSAISSRSSRSRSTTNLEIGKRKLDDDSVEVEDSNNNDLSIKRRKLFKNETSDYLTKEIELDINTNLIQSQNNEYITKEFDIDINNLT
ncbi:hypothetical protein RclHR1_08780002 [Rhizophagus clarus]|uniref:Protein kinase domain-containing protein n=1 Tax=Rhizophagus clarus TaxID=94130 RepID=A0A2Z6S4D7_9GLOM|nr:hypothetical protein RclHR1_08780002 [Rhizophagus clarus]